jgi:hypothetical protein
MRVIGPGAQSGAAKRGAEKNLPPVCLSISHETTATPSARLSLSGPTPFELGNLVNVLTLAVGEGALAFYARARNGPAIPNGPWVLYYG